MSQQPDIPSCHAGSPEPPAQPDGVRIHRLDSVGSTNELALAWLDEQERSHPAIWVAKEQSAGKGTRGRSWASPPGGLWLSIALPLGPTADRVIPGIGLRVGLALYRTCASSVPPEVTPRLRIRWPNDLIALGPTDRPQKVGGILIERRGDAVVIGIGINANNTPPPLDPSGSPMRTPAVALSDLSGEAIDLAQLETTLLHHTLPLARQEGLPPTILAEIDAALYAPRSPVTLTHRDGSTTRGHIAGISTSRETLGALVIRDESGNEQIVMTGDLQ